MVLEIGGHPESLIAVGVAVVVFAAAYLVARGRVGGVGTAPAARPRDGGGVRLRLGAPLLFPGVEGERVRDLTRRRPGDRGGWGRRCHPSPLAAGPGGTVDRARQTHQPSSRDSMRCPGPPYFLDSTARNRAFCQC